MRRPAISRTELLIAAATPGGAFERAGYVMLVLRDRKTAKELCEQGLMEPAFHYTDPAMGEVYAPCRYRLTKDGAKQAKLLRRDARQFVGRCRIHDDCRQNRALGTACFKSRRAALKPSERPQRQRLEVVR